MTSARWLSFEWGPEVQTFAVDGERFTHPTPTNTSPSHDVAHLIVAASGLPWKPSGPHENVCFAEYNSVLVEHLASTAAEHLWYPGRVSRSEVLDRVLAHVRWFCEVHYAPFPVEADEALSRFRAGVDLEATVRLIPIFLRCKAHEAEHRDFRSRYYRGAFSSADRPELCERSREPAQIFRRELARLVRSRAVA